MATLIETRHEAVRRGTRGLAPDRETYAAVDLGTNNCRLLVARPAGEGFRVIDAFSRIVRLGEGLGASGRLSEAAMARTIEALKICVGKMRRRGVTAARAVATEACRRAANCEAFLARVRAETDLTLEIISNREEARLGLYGCVPLLDDGAPYALIFDIGGGSTEISWLAVQRHAGAAQPRLQDWHSVPLGVVTLAERYGGHDIAAETYQAMIREVAAALAPFEARHSLADRVARGEVQVLGTSGTVTTLAGLQKNLRRYDRTRVDGCYLDFESAIALSRQIAAMAYEERVAQPCIGRERADLVVAGCAVLEAICQTWPADRLRVADRGLREGILFHLMRTPGRSGAAGQPGIRAHP